MDDTDIFTDAGLERIKRLNKPVTIARVIMFCLAGISLVITLLALYVGTEDGHTNDEDAVLVINMFIVLTLLYLTFAILSIRKALISMVMTSIITVLVLSGIVIGFFIFDESYTSVLAWSITATLLGVTLLQIRGAVFARKQNKLRSIIN